MIAWWGWALIWTALVAVLLGMLTFFAIVLFRKGLAVAMQFGDLASATIVFDGVHRAEPDVRALAVLGSSTAARGAWDARMQRRTLRKSSRRAERLARARRLIRAFDEL